MSYDNPAYNRSYNLLIYRFGNRSYNLLLYRVGMVWGGYRLGLESKDCGALAPLVGVHTADLGLEIDQAVRCPTNLKCALT